MKRTSKAVWALSALLVGSPTAIGAELTLEQYVALSIQRLELAEQRWSAARQPPAPEEMTALFSRYGTTEGAFMAYTGANREAIDRYLAGHPSSKGRIDELSARIQHAIKDQPR